MKIDPAFWKDKRVFITGHTGFKGSWLCLWLHRLGARLTGYSLVPPTTPSLFEMVGVSELIEHRTGDVRDLDALRAAMVHAAPDVVFHMAAQSLVRKGYAQPIETYQTNIMGTAHLLEAARSLQCLRSVVVVTSDKCYENHGRDRPFLENDPLGGRDPYSASKACAEIVAASYRASFYSGENSAGVATVRAGNVIGGGDFAEDRIVPDIISACQSGKPVKIRNPRAIRPWQDVLEPLAGYLTLAEQLYANKAFAGAYNFGPPLKNCRDVAFIADELCRMLGGHWQCDDAPQLFEEPLLRLNSDKAYSDLQWTNCFSLEETLSYIASFATETAGGRDARELCLKHIETYEARTTVIPSQRSVHSAH